MLEDIPRHGPELADELRRVGAEINALAEQELADLYPKDPTEQSPSPTCGHALCAVNLPIAELRFP